MKKLLLNNWSLKLASVLFAALLWFLTIQIYDPQDVKTFSNIQVRLVNTGLLSKEGKIYDVLDGTDTVRVTIKAPTSVIGQLRAGDIVAEADISRLTDINTVPITYSVPNVSTENISGDHDVVRLDVENRNTRWINVISSTVGKVAEGYMVSNAVPDQNRIEISGPESVVSRVDHAEVSVDVSNATVDLSANVEIMFYDATGQQVEREDIVSNEKYMHMRVEVLAVKEVPIEVEYAGVPDAAYLATGVITSQPATVRLAGRTSALENVSKIVIPSDKLSISGSKEDVVETIRIKDYLPENTKLADADFNGKVTVTVGIEAKAEKSIEIANSAIYLVNQPNGVYMEFVEISPQNTVKISGRSSDLAALQVSGIKGLVDVAAWMRNNHLKELEPGTYLIPVKLELGEKIKAEQELFARVTVTNPSTE